MRHNPARRAALLDAAVEVLAREGARGLTYRAVDTEAAVPVGTASNYFANRDDLLNQVGKKIHERLGPDPSELAETMRTPPSRDLVVQLMQALFRRVTEDRSGYLALLELRLEATRRPGLRKALTETIRSNLDANVDFHLGSDLPGDRGTVVLLYLAMSGLIVEHLTLPEVLGEQALGDLIATLVARSVPQTSTSCPSDRELSATVRLTQRPAGHPPHMDEKQIISQIHELVDEEHQLREGLQRGEISSAEERARLRDLEESLDQCWDFLRQRRARIAAGENPDFASPRPVDEVEGYRQ